MQATLPLRFGCLGLRSDLKSSSAAFLSSFNATSNLVQRLLKTGSYRNVSTMDSMNLCITQSSFSQTLTLPGEIQKEKDFTLTLKSYSH